MEFRSSKTGSLWTGYSQGERRGHRSRSNIIQISAVHEDLAQARKNTMLTRAAKCYIVLRTPFSWELERIVRNCKESIRLDIFCCRFGSHRRVSPHHADPRFVFP